MDCRSFSDSRRCTRGSKPMRHASKRIMASVGVRTCPLYVSMSRVVPVGVVVLVFEKSGYLCLRIAIQL